jgi:hypothetical protein
MTERPGEGDDVILAAMSGPVRSLGPARCTEDLAKAACFHRDLLDGSARLAA